MLCFVELLDYDHSNCLYLDHDYIIGVLGRILICDPSEEWLLDLQLCQMHSTVMDVGSNGVFTLPTPPP